MPRKATFGDDLLKEMDRSQKEGMSYAQLSDEYGAKAGTIKSALSRWRKAVANLNATPPKANATAGTLGELFDPPIRPGPPANATPPEPNATANATAAPVRARMMEFLRQGGIWTQKEVAERIGANFEAVSKAMQRLPTGVLQRFEVPNAHSRGGHDVVWRIDPNGAYALGLKSGT